MLLVFSKSKYFDNFVMVLIGLSSVKLGLDSYIVDEIQKEEGFMY